MFVLGQHCCTRSHSALLYIVVEFDLCILAIDDFRGDTYLQVVGCFTASKAVVGLVGACIAAAQRSIREPYDEVVYTCARHGYSDVDTMSPALLLIPAGCCVPIKPSLS